MLSGMSTELDILADVSRRLDAAEVPFMLTGSFALAFYATPRMTRDLDIVVALVPGRIEAVTAAFADDYYVDPDLIAPAVRSESLFNVMHFASGMKVDLIVRKSTPYRIHEFTRRRRASLGDVATWIVSREDLILSKLAWSATSELQRRDVEQLLKAEVDVAYLRHWAVELGVRTALDALLQ
jgi:hypothetical protein